LPIPSFLALSLSKERTWQIPCLSLSLDNLSVLISSDADQGIPDNHLDYELVLFLTPCPEISEHNKSEN